MLLENFQIFIINAIVALLGTWMSAHIPSARRVLAAYMQMHGIRTATLMCYSHFGAAIYFDQGRLDIEGG